MSATLNESSDIAVSAIALAGAAAPMVLIFDRYALDVDEVRLHRDDGVALVLPPRAFAVLAYLARNPGRLIRKDELLDAVWGHQHVSESVLKSVVSQIRNAMGDAAQAPRLIETVSRRGYRFIATVTCEGRGAADGGDLSAVRPAPAAPHLADASARENATAVPAVHLPPRGRQRLIGRDDSLARLSRAWSTALCGQRQLLLVAGEPGIGKTSLLDGFIDRVAPATVAIGQCVDRHGAGEPYLPMLEALDALCRRDPGLPALLRTVAPTWLLQMPWYLDEADRQALARELTGATQDRMLREMGVLLDRIAQWQPLLIVIEDLHWCDDATVRLIDHLARRRDSACLMIVGSFRPADVIASGHPIGALRRELRLHRLCDELLLEGFTRSQVADYVAHRLAQAGAESGPAAEGDGDGAPRVDDGASPVAAPAATIAALHQHTDGLPLFVASVVDELIEQRLLSALARAPGVAQDADSRPASLPVPDNLVGVIEHQLRRLPDGQRTLLQAAALIGIEFDHLTLADALGLEAGEIQHGFDELVTRQLWLRGGEAQLQPDGRIGVRYAFRHALHRHVLEAGLGMATRIGLHRALGRALQRTHAHRATELAAELALHAERGRDLPAAAGWLLQAARNARQRLAQAESLALVERALKLLESVPAGPGRAAELPLLSLLIAGQMTTLGQGVPAAARSARRALTIMDALPMTLVIAPLWHAVWWVHARSGDWRTARSINLRMAELTDRALGDAQSPDTLHAIQSCVHAQQGILALHVGEHAAAIDAFDLSLWHQDATLPDAVRPAFVQDLRIECLAHQGLACELSGRFARGAQVRRELQRRIDQGTDPLSETTGLWFVAFQHLLRRDLVALGQIEVRALAGIEGRDALSGTGPHRVVRGWLAAQRATETGEREAALALARDGVRAYAEHGARSGTPVMRRLFAEALVPAGGLTEAREQLRLACAEVASIGELGSGAEAHRVDALLRIAEGATDEVIEACFDMAVDCALRERTPLLELLAQVSRGQWLLESDQTTGKAFDKARLLRWQTQLRELLGRLEPDPTLVVRKQALQWLATADQRLSARA